MTSLDSIGSCSLDAYASSSEGTDPLSGAIKFPPEQPHKRHGHEKHQAGEDDDELASACTLCSVSALSSQSPTSLPSATGFSKAAGAATESSEYVRKTARLFEEPDKEEPNEDETDFLNIPAAKKPSYLGLACSLSGYSGLTSYDSKLREGFRTRDRSPAPPHPRPLTVSNMPRNIQPTVNGISATNTNGIQTVSPQSHVNGAMTDGKSPQPGPSAMKEAGSSILRESSRQFMSAMLSDEPDFSNCTRMLHVHPQGPSPCTPKDCLSPSGSAHNVLKRSPGTVRIVEFTSQTKSYVNAVDTSTTTLRSSLQTSSVKESHQYTSEISIGTVNGANNLQGSPKSSRVLTVESESTVPSGYCVTKSFVQQRIERLYGPGALAQGFFSRTRQQSLTEEELIPQSPEISGHSAVGSPSLPVLRHLRPEFRAQLPLTPSIASRSPRHTVRDLSISYESCPSPPVLQQQTSVESISDSQPAAPEVPILIGENIPVMSVRKLSDSFKSPASCKDAGIVLKCDTPIAISITNNVDHSITPGDRHNSSSVGSYILSDEITDEEKNGHYFLKVLHGEIQRLNELVESAEKELESNTHLPEEAQGKLRAASGQARLLMKQKLQQFEGLCYKNINQSPDEVFPTTAQDLAGFWDMVKLQVDHVDKLFAEIDRLKSCGWVDTSYDIVGGVASCGIVSSSSRRKPGSRRNTSNASGSKTKGSEDQKRGNDGSRKKDELALARKRMMEEKRRILKQQQLQQQQFAKEEDTIKIFVPDENRK